MIEVSKSQFFASLYADKRDIMPSDTAFGKEPFSATTDWRIVNGRRLWGRSTSYGPDANRDNQYWLNEKESNQ